MFKKEDGFSLVELAVAATIAIVLAGAGVLVTSGLTGNADSAVTDYQNDGVETTNAICDSTSGANPSVQPIQCDNNSNFTPGGTGGVTAVYMGGVLSYSVDVSKCNVTNPDASYYYTDSGNGSAYMGSYPNNSFNPASAGFPIGGSLGYGVTITSYHVTVDCDNVPTRSDNDAH